MLPGFVRSPFAAIALLLGASLVLHVDSSAQVGRQRAHATEQPRLAPLVSVDPSSIRHATLEMSTGRLTRGANLALGSGSSLPIYNHFVNDQIMSWLNLGAFDPALVGPATASMIDEGRIPGTSGGGPADSYLVTHLVFFYATQALDPDSGGPGSSLRISIWDSGAYCTPTGTLGTPSQSFEWQGLPGREPWESTAFYSALVILDDPFTIVADSNGVAGDGDGDLFAWSMEWLNDEPGGPVMFRGTYSSFCSPGSGTFGDASCGFAWWTNAWGAVPAGHGLDTVDRFYLQYSSTPPASSPEGCYWFGGPTDPSQAFASFQLVLGGQWDFEAPDISCPAEVREFDRLDGTGKTVTFTVTATDDFDPQPNIVCNPPSGSLFYEGTTIVNCTATDAAGNWSTCSFPVIVGQKVRLR